MVEPTNRITQTIPRNVTAPIQKDRAPADATVPPDWSWMLRKARSR